MIKRIISSLISVMILCSVISVVVFAEDTEIVSSGTFGADGDNLSWKIDSEGTLTVSGIGSMGYNIPWLFKKADIKKFVAEEGITAIASGAMSDCPELAEVYLPKGLRSIDSQAFYNCISLENINLPSGLEEIGDYAFSNCNSLTKIIIPESVTSIGMSAFECCVSLEEVVLPDKIESLPDHCFCDSISLKKINIPSGLKSLANKVFGYTNIGTLDLTNDLEYMEYNPFLWEQIIDFKM